MSLYIHVTIEIVISYPLKMQNRESGRCHDTLGTNVVCKLGICFCCIVFFSHIILNCCDLIISGLS